MNVRLHLRIQSLLVLLGTIRRDPSNLVLSVLEAHDVLV